jgi:integrase
MSYAIRWGAVDDNPCRLVKGNVEKPRNRYISDDEYIAVYELAPDVVQAAMRLALITGLRQGDLLALRLQNLTDDGLEVETNKTGRRLLFEWTPDLREAVNQAKNLPRDVRGMFLLCTKRGRRYTSSGFQSIWQRVMRNAMERQVISERFTFHDIRAKTGSESKDDNLLGHRNQRTLSRHYKRKALRVTPLTPKVLDR